MTKRTPNTIGELFENAWNLFIADTYDEDESIEFSQDQARKQRRSSFDSQTRLSEVSLDRRFDREHTRDESEDLYAMYGREVNQKNVHFSPQDEEYDENPKQDTDLTGKAQTKDTFEIPGTITVVNKHDMKKNRFMTKDSKCSPRKGMFFLNRRVGMTKARDTEDKHPRKDTSMSEDYVASHSRSSRSPRSPHHEASASPHRKTNSGRHKSKSSSRAYPNEYTEEARDSQYEAPTSRRKSSHGRDKTSSRTYPNEYVDEVSDSGHRSSRRESREPARRSTHRDTREPVGHSTHRAARNPERRASHREPHDQEYYTSRRKSRDRSSCHQSSHRESRTPVHRSSHRDSRRYDDYYGGGRYAAPERYYSQSSRYSSRDPETSSRCESKRSVSVRSMTLLGMRPR